MNVTAIRALVRNDLRLYLADRRAVVVGVLVPILIAAFFGYVFGGAGRNSEAGKIPIAVVDEDQSAVSRAITADLSADKMLQITTLDRAAAREQVKAGKQNAAAVFPKGFGAEATRALFGGQAKPQVELFVDPSQIAGPRIIEGLLAQYSMQEISKEAFTGAMGREVMDGVIADLDRNDRKSTSADLKALLESARRLNAQRDAAAAAGDQTGAQRGFGLTIPYTVAATEVTARDAAPYNSYAHSFAGMAVQFILLAGIDAGVLLLLTRQRGIWQRLRSAPLRRGEFMVARLVATTLISLFQFTLIYLAAMLLFKVRVEGSWLGFAGIGLAFCLLNAAFGLMLATIGRSAPATRGIANMVTLLLVMIGGAWVPAFVFPRWLQSASLYAPTRWAVDGLDGATWRGLPAGAATLPVLVMVGTAAVCLGVAIWRFRWEE
jgi:ABC-2 type transport system permease protein